MQSSSRAQDATAGVIHQGGRPRARTDFARQHPYAGTKKPAALCLSFGRLGATDIGTGRDQRHAQMATQARRIGVGGNTHREFGVCAGEPARRTRRQQQADRTRPVACDVDTRGSIEFLQKRFKPGQAVADQNQSLGLRTPLQTQQAPHRAGMRGVAPKAVARLGRIRDQPARMEMPNQTRTWGQGSAMSKFRSNVASHE